MFKELFTEAAWPKKFRVVIEDPKLPSMDADKIVEDFIKAVQDDLQSFGYGYGQKITEKEYFNVSYARLEAGGDVQRITIEAKHALVYSGKEKTRYSKAYKEYFKQAGIKKVKITVV